jgi:hypothetical protein
MSLAIGYGGVQQNDCTYLPAVKRVLQPRASFSWVKTIGVAFLQYGASKHALLLSCRNWPHKLRQNFSDGRNQRSLLPRPRPLRQTLGR